MWNELTAEDLEKLSMLYGAEDIPAAEKIIHEHFFLGGCDWYIAEYYATKRVFFGYAILNNDFDNAEWGYISLDELRGVNVHGIEVDRDLHWKQRRASEIERILQSGGV